MTFSQAVEIIRDRAGSDIVGIVGSYVDLKRSGDRFEGLCPFHDEKTASFNVNESEGYYKCFGCGEGGDAIRFVMEMEGKDFRETIFHLADRYNLAIDDKTDEKYRKQRSVEEEILPGITEKKGQIRKAGKVYVAMDKTEFVSSSVAKRSREHPDYAPIVLITTTISKEEAEILWKYADKVILIPGNETRWPELRDSLKVLLPFFDFLPKRGPRDLRIFCQNLTETIEEDWLTYIVPEIGEMVQRKEVSQLLALIPDNLYRDIYTTEFAKLLSEKSE